MTDWAHELLRLPPRAVADLSSQDVPVDPGIYAWYRLLVGKANLEALAQANEVLTISLADGIVRLD
jgi:hypothetical protein